jgi:hypothetical protein
MCILLLLMKLLNILFQYFNPKLHRQIFTIRTTKLPAQFSFVALL